MTAAESLNPENSIWAWIAVNLRKERLKRKLSQADVAKIIEADKPRVANYEAGRLKLTQHHAELIDQAWGTMYASLRKFAVMFGSADDWVQQLYQFEEGALVIKIYFRSVVPIPMQNEGYAQSILTLCRVVDDVERATRERMFRRKALLDQLPRMSLFVLIDEKALTPTDFPSDAVSDQLKELLELMRHRAVSVRVVPESLSSHIGVDGDFELITTASGREVAYVWAQLGGRLVHEPAEVRELALRYDRIGANALAEADTRELIRRKSESLQ